jgi:Icc protein
LSVHDRPLSQTRSKSRRRFLQTASVVAVSIALSDSAHSSVCKISKPVRLGMITDLHQDIMHDGPQRLGAFLAAMKNAPPDAIIQLGDFAVPAKKNQLLIETFNAAHPQALHVLGNHDADGGYSYEQTMTAWGMPERYYFRDIGGLRVIVLDGNEPPPNHQDGYPSHIGPEQIKWLRGTLESHDGPIIVISHQPLAGPWAIDNAKDVQSVLSSAADRVLLAVNGHTHIDELVRVDGVGYLHLNSASYVWVGNSFRHESYGAEIHAAHPRLAGTCPYRDSLFTTLTIDPASGRIDLQGSVSRWVGPSPAELGRDKHPDLIDGEQIVPAIRARKIKRIATQV